jgi:hypothetical protein
MEPFNLNDLVSWQLAPGSDFFNDIRRDELALQAKRKHWEALHHKTQSLQKIVDSALVTEMKQEAKREQLEQDEWASRSGRKSETGIGNAK